MCVLLEPLGDIGRIEMSTLLFIVIIISDSFIIVIGIISIYYYYLEFYIVPTMQKEKRKYIALPTMWK